MTIEDVKQFLDENSESEEVKNFLSSLKNVSTESIIDFLNTEEGQRVGLKVFQPELDRRATKAIETWRTNHGAKTDEEVKAEMEKLRAELNPKETEEQKALRETNARLESLQQELRRKELNEYRDSKMTEKGIDFKFRRFINGSSEEDIDASINAFKESTDEMIRRKLEEKTKPFEPGTGGTQNVANPWRKEHWNMTEQLKLLNENPDLATKLKREAGKI
jgi:hypothetical protein